jgi:fibronectin type 3 domain-containing protein
VAEDSACKERQQMQRYPGVPRISRKGLLTLLILVVWILSCSRESGLHSVTLTWHASPSTASEAVASYNVYRRTDNPPSPYVKIASHVSVARFEDQVVRRGETYVYAVTVVDQRSHESRFSNVTKVEVR